MDFLGFWASWTENAACALSMGATGRRAMTTATGQVRRRVGERLEWPVAHSIEDEILGLSYGELIELWEERGLPEGWSVEMAAELRGATWCVVSAQIGAMAGARLRWGSTVGTLARLCASERFDEESDELKATPFDDLAEFDTELRADPAFGWGTGPSGLRRLYEYGQEHGPFGHVAGRRAEPWQPAHDDDHEPLDRAWAVALRHGPRRPRLPIEVCSLFAAPKRERTVLGVEGLVGLPSVFQLVATFLVWGPDEVRARGFVLLSDEAEREVAPRVNRPEGGRVARGTLENIATDIYSWMLRAHEAASGHPELLKAWLPKPRPLPVEDLESVEDWRADRSGVPLHVYRRTRSLLRDKVERARRRDGTLDPTRTMLNLRDLLLVDLTGTGARIGELARIRPCDYIPEWHCDDRVVPAVRLRPRKTRRGRPAAWRIKAIHPETARYLEEWFEFVGLSRDEERPIWMSRFSYSDG